MKEPVRRRLRRWLRAGDSGATLVEFALALPVLFGFLLGLVQVCLAYYSWEFISEAAREATRYAIVHGATCETSSGTSCEATASQISAVANNISLPNVGGSTFNAVTTFPDGGQTPGQRVLVTVTYNFPYRIPFSGQSLLTLSSKSEMYIIQ